MLTIKLISAVILAVFLLTVSTAYPQEKTLISKSENIIPQISAAPKSSSDLFTLHSSVPVSSGNVSIIEFELGEEASVMLTVSNSKGKLLETLVDDVMDPGDYKIHFKSAEIIVPGELTYKLEVKGISGVKNIFKVK